MFTKRQCDGTNNYDRQFVHSNWSKKGQEREKERKVRRLTHKYKTRVKVILSDKHSNSLRCRIIYNHKNVTVQGTCLQKGNAMEPIITIGILSIQI